MTNEQEIRAKALETAVLILGELPELERKAPPPYSSVSKFAVDYGACFNHYLHLAELIEQYICEAETD
jgi:hypothetical protein